MHEIDLAQLLLQNLSQILTWRISTSDSVLILSTLSFQSLGLAKTPATAFANVVGRCWCCCIPANPAPAAAIDAAMLMTLLLLGCAAS